MSKKRDEGKLTMHKLLGDHQFVKTTICEECGITEGQKIIESYQPIHFTSEEIADLIRTVTILGERMRSMQQQLDVLRQNHIDRGVGGGAKDQAIDRWKREYGHEWDWDKTPRKFDELNKFREAMMQGIRAGEDEEKLKTTYTTIGTNTKKR